MWRDLLETYLPFNSRAFPKSELLVKSSFINDCPTDVSLKRFKENFQLLENKKNITCNGFGFAVYQGIRKALCKLVFLLNSEDLFNRFFTLPQLLCFETEETFCVSGRMFNSQNSKLPTGKITYRKKEQSSLKFQTHPGTAILNLTSLFLRRKTQSFEQRILPILKGSKRANSPLYYKIENISDKARTMYKKLPFGSLPFFAMRNQSL